MKSAKYRVFRCRRTDSNTARPSQSVAAAYYQRCSSRIEYPGEGVAVDSLTYIYKDDGERTASNWRIGAPHLSDRQLDFCRSIPVSMDHFRDDNRSSGWILLPHNARGSLKNQRLENTSSHLQSSTVHCFHRPFSLFPSSC